MSEDEERREIREWIRKKIEKINTKQSEANTSKINEFENGKKSDNPEMNEHKREDVDKLLRKENRLIKRLKLLVIVLLVLNSSILFSYIYLKHFLSEPIILKIHENQYNYSTIKLKGTLIYFWVSPKTRKGIGYIENEGYVISILNLTNLNYSVGDVIETNSSIIKGVAASLESLSDRKIGKSNIMPKKELSIDDINKNPKNYEWLLIGIKNAVIESINITSTLPSLYDKEEYYVIAIKIKGLSIDSYYIGPKLNIEAGKSHNLLATVMKLSNEVYTLRIFNIY
jgi:hypothetical protein